MITFIFLCLIVIYLNLIYSEKENISFVKVCFECVSVKLQKLK